MKAIVYTEYGPPEVLRLAEVEKPVPQDNQVLIRIYATTAAAAEVMERKGESVIGRIILYRYFCGTVCQVLWRRRHRRLQHHPCGTSEIAGSQSGG